MPSTYHCPCPECRTFLYTMSTNWNKSVSSVIFDISRYGKHTHRIDFATPVSFINAVLEVERFLSAPLDDAYYNRVADDLFHNYRQYYNIRGDCLGDRRFLESVRELESGVIVLWCGS
jgi:hypothetical protein